MKKLTNQGWSFVWALIAFFAYAIPVTIIAIIEKDRFFADVGTSLTLVSIIAIVLFLVFCKKLVKRICGFLTPLWFGSLVILFISIGIKKIAQDLELIAITSLVASVIAWFPFQMASVYGDRAKDQNGDVIREEGMPFKVAVGKLFQLSIFVKTED